MKANIFFVLLLGTSGVTASSIQLAIETPLTEQLFLESNPITLTLTNQAGKPLAISRAVGWFSVEKLTSKGWTPCDPSGSIGLSGGVDPRWEVLMPGDSEERTWNSICPDWQDIEGFHQFRITWTHHPPQDVQFVPEGASVFRGVVVSNELEIRVVRPAGIDAKAYEALRGGENGGYLLKHAPTSRYTGAVIAREGGTHFHRNEPASVLDMIQRGVYLSKRPLPTPDSTTPGGGRTHDPEEVLAWRSKWFKSVLVDHPEIWFAADLRLRLALDKLAMKDIGGASTDLQILAEEGSGSAHERAREYLFLMIEKGMIERDSVDAELLAKFPLPTKQ